MITNIDIDEQLVAEAMKVSGARTKREVVDRALRDMVARTKRTRLRDVFGIGGIDADYDPKDPQARGSEVARWRVEQPQAEYKVKPAAQEAAPKPPKPPKKR
jgi:hypothetical protein